VPRRGPRRRLRGIPQLRRELRSRGREQLPLYAGAATIAALEKRFRRVDHCDFKPVRPGRPRRLGGVERRLCVRARPGYDGLRLELR
jgi:hypothetical protein